MSHNFPYGQVLKSAGPLRIALAAENPESGAEVLELDANNATVEILAAVTDLPDKIDGYMLSTGRKRHRIAIFIDMEELSPEFIPTISCDPAKINVQRRSETFYSYGDIDESARGTCVDPDAETKDLSGFFDVEG